MKIGGTMNFLKKIFDLNSYETFTQKDQREVDESSILQDYIDKYNLNFMTSYVCRVLISNGFSAKEAINVVDETREYTFEEISTFDQLKKMCSTENNLDYDKYKEAIIDYFSKL